MGQKKLLKFLSLWVGTTIFALILSFIFGNKFVLGNAAVTSPVAGIILGLVLTIAFFGAGPVTLKLDVKIKDKKAWVGIFFVANSVLIWIFKRLADFTGVGVSSIIFVLLIAAILTAGQYYIDKYSQSFIKKNL